MQEEDLESGERRLKSLWVLMLLLEASNYEQVCVLALVYHFYYQLYILTALQDWAN